MEAKSEALHTRPHAVAPHPEWWHAPDSDSTECEVTELVAALVRAIQPEVVVETGTAFGHTAVAIAESLRRNGHGKLYTLEPNGERRAAAEALALARMGQHHGGWVEFLPDSSLDWTPPGPIQFAWFDSLYELRVDEFLRYHGMGLLQPGTVVGFHDWTSGIRGHYMDVRGQVEDRLVRPGYLRAVYVPTPRGAVIAEVLR